MWVYQLVLANSLLHMHQQVVDIQAAAEGWVGHSSLARFDTAVQGNIGTERNTR